MKTAWKKKHVEIIKKKKKNTVVFFLAVLYTVDIL